MLYDGQLEWQDGPVSFHGDIDPMFMVRPKCEDIRRYSEVFYMPTVMFTGTYTPRSTGAPGMFTLTVYDGGEPGTINGDFIQIDLTTGEYAGYSNAGFIQGGNIQVF